MGFRLSSAIAGFAERTSENLTALQDKADEITKTAAATYAQEALQVRKERMKSRREYLSAAEDLESYGLNNNQIETILKGGIKNADLFKQSLQDAEAAAKEKGETFDRKVAISAMFTGDEQGDGRAIAKQAELYAQKMFGFVQPDMDAIGKSAAEATQTLFGSVDKKYTVAQFNAQMKALGGATPISYDENAGYGQTGLSHNLGGLSYEKALAYKTANLQNEKLIGDINAQIGEQEYLKLLRPLDLQRTRKLLAGLDTQEALNQANLQKAGYENIALKRENAQYFTNLRKKEKLDDLTLKTAKIQLKQLTKDLYSPQVNPSQVWGSLLATKNSILNGEMTFENEENKTEALKVLEGQITNAAIQTEAFYDYQKGKDKDYYGFSAFNSHFEGLLAKAEEDAGIVTTEKGNQFIEVGGERALAGSPAFKDAQERARINAEAQFKEAFTTDGTPDNDAVAAIIKGFEKKDEQAQAMITSEEIAEMGEDAYLLEAVNDADFDPTNNDDKLIIANQLAKAFPDKYGKNAPNAIANLNAVLNNLPEPTATTTGDYSLADLGLESSSSDDANTSVAVDPTIDNVVNAITDPERTTRDGGINTIDNLRSTFANLGGAGTTNYNILKKKLVKNISNYHNITEDQALEVFNKLGL